jgi:hypothetical protein
MNPLTTAKVALAVVGLLVFAYGIRVDSQSVRWVGIAFVAAAAVLRFVKPRSGGAADGRDEG